MYSIVETAKAKHANVLIYLQYLFEQIPLCRAGGDRDFMADMMLWSEAYRMYEAKKQLQRRSLYGRLFPEPEYPRAPRKRERGVEMPQGDDLTANEHKAREHLLADQTPCQSLKRNKKLR